LTTLIMTSTFSVMKNPMMLVLCTRGMLVELASFSLSSKIIRALLKRLELELVKQNYKMEVKNTTLREESSYRLKEKEVLMWNMNLLLPLLPNGNWSHFDTYCKDDINR